MVPANDGFLNEADQLDPPFIFAGHFKLRNLREFAADAFDVSEVTIWPNMSSPQP
jgi:hypothetical protein